MNLHSYGATVEAELGKLVGQEDDLIVEAKDAAYTDPDIVVEFVERTEVDALAVAIGTGHGTYDTKPELDFDRLEKVKNLIDIPTILHGGSGLTDEDTQKCISLGCAKVNVSTELKTPFSKALRQFLIDNPNESDTRKYIAPAKEKMKEATNKKILVCMSDGKA